MNYPTLNQKTELQKHKNIVIFIGYLLLIWLAYYFKFSKFGFYEDDYYIAGIPADSTFAELLNFIKQNLVSFDRNQGRFVAIILPYMITFINFKLGGVAALYIFGMFLVAFNAFLIYKIVNKNFPFEVAILTGLIFALFPADTTKALIVHIYHLHISLVFTLLGMLCYVNNKKLPGYILAFTSLMNYENAFLPFLAVPFFIQSEWNRKLFMGWIRHILLIGCWMVILVSIRKLLGENTISNIDIRELIRRTLISFAAGPATSIYSFFNAIARSLANIKITWYIILGAFAVLSVIMSIWPTILGSRKSESETGFRFNSDSKLSAHQLILVKAIGLGISMSIIGYSFSFTHFPPTTIIGRITSVHFGAAFGIALMIAGGIRFLLSLDLMPMVNKIISAVVIAVLSLCAGYGMLIQEDYVKSWELQQKFWHNVVKECPDIQENTLILVQNDSLIDTKFVVSYSWAFPLIYNQIYNFPVEWKRDPILDIIDDPAKVISGSNGNIFYKPAYPFMFNNKPQVPIENGNLILLKMEGDVLVRIYDTLSISPELSIALKIPDNENVLVKDDLYQTIIGN